MRDDGFAGIEVVEHGNADCSSEACVRDEVNTVKELIIITIVRVWFQKKKEAHKR